jgi:single-strand DNA-binding protein
MFNRIILMGRLTKDPELKTTQSGITMCRFSIAVDRAYSKGQEKQTDFFDITAWRQTAEFVSKYFSKGKCILIEGKLQNNNYTDQNGVKHYQNVVIADNVAFCGDKSGGQQNGQAPPAQQPYQNQYQQGYTQNQGYQQPYQQGYNQPQQGYPQRPQNYQQPQQNQGYQQNYNAPAQNQPPQGYRQNNQPPPNVDMSLGDFEEILSDSEVPF